MLKEIYASMGVDPCVADFCLEAEEGLKKTDNDLIHIGCPIPFDTDEFLNNMANLIRVAYSNCDDIRDTVKQLVSTYNPQ